jgi:hypothetical protein
MHTKNCPILARFKPVLRIRDVYPGSRSLIFIRPISRIQQQHQEGGKLLVLPFL